MAYNVQFVWAFILVEAYGCESATSAEPWSTSVQRALQELEKAYSAKTLCFNGTVGSKVTTQEKKEHVMCVVAKFGSQVVFGQNSLCPSEGCHNDATGAPYCCCKEHLCNTVSFFHLNNGSTYVDQYIAHIIILIIVIAKLLILLIINCGCPRVVDKNPRFKDKIHLDFTQFLIQPRLNDAEEKKVIERIAKDNQEVLQVALDEVYMEAVVTYSTDNHITYREAKHQAKISDMSDPVQIEEVLHTLIRLGPCEIDWDVDIMHAILKKAYDILMDEPTLLELSVPITVYGDIHGQYSDVWRWLHANGWPPATRCLFLGDYVDRGRHSTEVLMFLLLLKVVMPKSVFLIRGNHEDAPVNKAYNFQSEVHTRFPRREFRSLYRRIRKVFCAMPIACIISEQIICMHGGLSPKIHTVAEIAAMQKPIVTESKNDAHLDILWSDPHVDVLMWGPNFFRDPAGAGVGQVFGPIQINKFVKRNNLSLIVRAHQPPITGYERVGKHLLTIFSTAGYRVVNGVGNMGASLVIDENGGMTVVRFQVGEQLKMKRQRYKMDKGDRYRDCGKPKLKKNVDVDDRYD